MREAVMDKSQEKISLRQKSALSKDQPKTITVPKQKTSPKHNPAINMNKPKKRISPKQEPDLNMDQSIARTYQNKDSSCEA